MVEQNFGWFTCMGDNDTIRSVWPEELEAFLYDKGIDRHNAKAPEGESRADVVERARHVVERHRADFEDPNTDVILIGHGVINRAMEMCLRGEGEEWFHATKNPNNCDVHKLEGNLGIGYAPTECIHESKLRPKTLPQYKAEPYGEDKVLMR
jgi:2,3-bisphosphoglycerate-dependent phosphoglycerate mutase